MSDHDETPKRTLKDRLKSNLPAASAGLAVGVLVAVKLRPHVAVNIVSENAPGTVLLSAELVRRVVEHGSAMFEIVPGLHVDVIDWSNPANEVK